MPKTVSWLSCLKLKATLSFSRILIIRTAKSDIHADKNQMSIIFNKLWKFKRRQSRSKAWKERNPMTNETWAQETKET